MRSAKFVLLSAITLLALTTIAQNADRECERMKLLASEALVSDDYKTAVSYLLKAEKSCEGLDQESWQRLTGILETVINEEPFDSETRLKYIDTALRAWERQEDSGVYTQTDDLIRATYIMQSVPPDLERAYSLFHRGIKSEGVRTHESYLVYAFYTTYLIWESAEESRKVKLKNRMLTDYLFYSDIADSSNASENAKKALDTYFGYIFSNCEEILPHVSPYLDSLPENERDALHSIILMIRLIEDKRCSKGEEYISLVDKWLELDSNSVEANWRKCIHLNKNNHANCLPELMNSTNDTELKAKIQYAIARSQFSAGQYKAACASGKACTGEFRSKGLLIAAQSVAALANSCGTSTFDQKCNFLYAAQLAEEAGFDEKANRYRAKGPSNDCSGERDSKPVYLTCWDVTVNVCP